MNHMPYRGKQYPIHFGYYALKQLKETSGKNFNGEQDNFEVLEILLYYSLKAGHGIEGKKFLWIIPMPFMVSRKKVARMLDYNLEWFIQFIDDSMPKKKILGSMMNGQAKEVHQESM